MKYNYYDKYRETNKHKAIRLIKEYFIILGFISLMLILWFAVLILGAFAMMYQKYGLLLSIPILISFIVFIVSKLN